MFGEHSLNYFTSSETVRVQQVETFKGQGKNLVLCEVQTTIHTNHIMIGIHSYSTFQVAFVLLHYKVELLLIKPRCLHGSGTVCPLQTSLMNQHLGVEGSSVHPLLDKPRVHMSVLQHGILRKKIYNIVESIIHFSNERNYIILLLKL